MKVRGLVTEIDGDGLIILTPQGAFHRMPLQGSPPRVGEEVEVTIGGHRWARALWAVAAAALLFLAVVTSLPSNPPLPPVVTYVALDINPSLGLYLDREEQVVRAEGLNPEGEELLGQVPVAGTKLEEALAQLVSGAVAQGYVHSGSTNLILTAVVPLAEGDRGPSMEDVARAVNAGLDPQHQAVVAVQLATAADLEKAQQEDLSLNKHLIKEKAREKGKELPVEDLAKNPVQEVLVQGETTLAELFLVLDQQPGQGQGPYRITETGAVIAGPPGQLKKVGIAAVPPGQAKKVEDEVPAEEETASRVSSEQPEEEEPKPKQLPPGLEQRLEEEESPAVQEEVQAEGSEDEPEEELPELPPGLQKLRDEGRLPPGLENIFGPWRKKGANRPNWG